MSLLKLRGSLCFNETSLLQYGPDHALAVINSSQIPSEMQQSHTLYSYNNNNSVSGSKVITTDEDAEISNFCKSGLLGHAEEKDLGLILLNKVMPHIHDGNADCGIIFSKELNVSSKKFEENGHFTPGTTNVFGKGVSGVVTLHTDRKSGFEFVCKRVQNGKSLRKEEIEVMLTLQHHNVCQVYGLLCHSNQVDILMQNCGQSLRQYLPSLIKENITADQYWITIHDLACQGFEALSYMHEQNFCHLDIKPENILVKHSPEQEKPVLFLADFGASMKSKEQMNFNLQFTQEYWAPELWLKLKPFPTSSQAYLSHLDNINKQGFSPQASFDTYAMGLTVYYMCTHRHLLKELEGRKNIISPEELNRFLQNFNTKDPHGFFFKFILMTEHADLISYFATNGNWIRPSIPGVLLQLMEHTLNPCPIRRFTDNDALTFLKKNPVMVVSSPLPETGTLKAPTQVYYDTEMMCEDAHVQEAHMMIVETGGLPGDIPTSMAVLASDKHMDHLVSPEDFDVGGDVQPTPCSEVTYTPQTFSARVPFISYQDQTFQVAEDAECRQAPNVHHSQLENNVYNLSCNSQQGSQNKWLDQVLDILEQDSQLRAMVPGAGGQPVDMDLAMRTTIAQPLEQEPPTTPNYIPDEKKRNFGYTTDNLAVSGYMAGHTLHGGHLWNADLPRFAGTSKVVPADNAFSCLQPSAFSQVNLRQGAPHDMELFPSNPQGKGGGIALPSKRGSKGKLRLVPYDSSAPSTIALRGKKIIEPETPAPLMVSSNRSVSALSLNFQEIELSPKPVLDPKSLGKLALQHPITPSRMPGKKSFVNPWAVEPVQPSSQFDCYQSVANTAAVGMVPESVSQNMQLGIGNVPNFGLLFF